MILRCVDNLWKESVSTSIELSENSATAITVGLQGFLLKYIIYGKENRQTLFKFLNFRNTITNDIAADFIDCR